MTCLMALLLVAAGCGRGAAIALPPPQQPVSGGTLRYALSADPISVTPLYGGDASGLVVERNVFAGLVDVNPATLQIVPSIARSWSASPDGRTFTFTLRPDVRFQGGAGAVTADTFVRDWTLLCSPDVGSPNAAALSSLTGYAACRAGQGGLTGVRAAGVLKLVVTLDKPFRGFVATLADPATWAFPPALADTAAARSASELAPLGAGPFQITSWTHGSAVPGKRAIPGDVVLAANPGYFGPQPHLQRVDLPVLDPANPAASFARYRSGGLDVVEVEASQVDVVRADPTFSRQLVDYPRLQLIALVATDPRSSSVAQRTTLAAALDPATIVSDVFGKAGQVADGLVPVGMPGYLPSTVPAPTADGPAPARVVLVRPTQPLLQAMADSVVRQLRSAAVDAAVSGRGRYQLQVVSAAYPSPDAVLAPVAALSNSGPAMLDGARAAADPSVRDALFVTVERRLEDRRVVIPIAFGQTELLVSPHVHGLLYDALGTPHLAAAWLGRA